MVNSRAKGANAERELARLLRAEGFDARRGQQYSGANGDADVVGLPGVHLEVKRTETFRLWDALAQAKHDARPGEMPVVVHRRNNCEWVVVMTLAHFLELYREADAAFYPVAEPGVKHGEWLITDAYPHRVYCSNCHRTYAQDSWDVWVDGSLPRNFCPWCGANMRERVSEDDQH